MDYDYEYDYDYDHNSGHNLEGERLSAEALAKAGPRELPVRHAMVRPAVEP
jgi:hypothetical protein